MYIRLSIKYPLFFSDFNEISIFCTTLPQNSQITNFMKICPLGTELFHADGRTDTKKLIVAFFYCNFANVPKNE